MTDKKAEPGRQTSETQRVADLLTSILNNVQKQVQSQTREPLEGKAVEAVELFREIGASLALQARPTITLRADRTQIKSGESVNLFWSSLEARAVSIAPDVGEVTPAAGGSIPATPSILPTTTYTATATNPCGRATAEVTIEVTITVPVIP
jgi:hypothetical protein